MRQDRYRGVGFRYRYDGIHDRENIAQEAMKAEGANKARVRLDPIHRRKETDEGRGYFWIDGVATQSQHALPLTLASKGQSLSKQRIFEKRLE